MRDYLFLKMKADMNYLDTLHSRDISGQWQPYLLRIGFLKLRTSG